MQLNKVTPYISRFLAAWLAPLLLWGAAKAGLPINEEMISSVTDLVTFASLFMLYSFVHRATDSNLNKGDAAVAPLVTELNAQADSAVEVRND